MNKKLLLIVGIVLVIVGCVASYLADFKLADVTGFAVTMFGAGLACVSLLEKGSEEKPWYLSVIGVACIGVGAFLLGFGGMAENTMTMIISSVTGVVAVIVGILLVTLTKKKEPEK